MIHSSLKVIFRRFTAGIALLLAFAFLFSAVSTFGVGAEGESELQAEAMLSGIIAFASGDGEKTVEEWIRGALCAEPQMNEWYAIGVSRLYPEADLTPYLEALENYLASNTVYSATTRQKYGLALIACGKTDSEYLSSLVDETAGKQGIMSYVFALHLLTNGAPSEKYAPENIVPALLKLACDGGGWSLTGKSPDPDVTAMTVQALSPYYDAYSEVKIAVDAAISRLSDMQAEDGGFSSYGEPNPESSAQVVIALTSIGRDPISDGFFVKNGSSPLDAIKEYRLSDGSFSHRRGDGYNLAATSQVFLALSALISDDSTPFFLFFDAPSDFPVLDSSVADTIPDRGESNGGENVGVGENVPNSGNDAVNPEEKGRGAYKHSVCIGVCALAVLVCAVMLVKKRRALSDYIIVVAVAVGICLAVTFIDVYTPDQYYGQTVKKDDPIGSVTVEIICDTELTGRDDAVIIGKTAVEIEEGETVYDVLTQVCRGNKVVLDAMAGSPTGGVYIRGIDGLHEFAHGDLSGWTYTVNGEQISIGSDKYTLSDGDSIVWTYSNTLGD